VFLLFHQVVIKPILSQRQALQVTAMIGHHAVAMPHNNL
jgi:hypothetical protein